jgi:hypothetical protein
VVSSDCLAIDRHLPLKTWQSGLLNAKARDGQHCKKR